MARLLLNDRQWFRIKDVLPKSAKTGRPPSDPRRILDGILWILRTGAPWRDLPEEFGPFQTIWRWFDRWTSDGTLDAILRHLQGERIDAGQDGPGTLSGRPTPISLTYA